MRTAKTGPASRCARRRHVGLLTLTCCLYRGPPQGESRARVAVLSWPPTQQETRRDHVSSAHTDARRAKGGKGIEAQQLAFQVLGDGYLQINLAAHHAVILILRSVPAFRPDLEQPSHNMHLPSMAQERGLGHNEHIHMAMQYGSLLGLISSGVRSNRVSPGPG